MDSREFEGKMREMADIMGYKLTLTEARNHAHLKRLVPGEEYYEDIFIRTVEGRLRIVGCYPEAKDGSSISAARAVITVTETKTAGQIVKEMERRLLPIYRKSLAEVIPKLKERNALIAMQVGHIEKLAKVCGVWQIGCDRRQNKEEFYMSGPNARGYVKARGESITIELSGISFEKAKRMLEALME